MRRRQLLQSLSAVFLAPSTVASQPGRIYRIGVVFPGGPYYAAVDGLRDGLKDAGFSEGIQYLLQIRDEHGDLKAAEIAARELERDRVDIIFSLPTSVSVAAKRATARVPIVFWAGNDAVDAGLVQSLARPGGRLTGVSSLSTAVTTKRLQLLKEISPALRRAITFYDPANPAAQGSLRWRALRPRSLE